MHLVIKINRVRNVASGRTDGKLTEQSTPEKEKSEVGLKVTE